MTDALQLLNPTKSKRVEAGKRAQSRGDDAEDAVERLHANDWFRIANPGVRLTRRYAKTIVKNGFAIPIKPQGPDFGGGGPAHVFKRVADLGVWVECEVKFVDTARDPRLTFDRFTDAEVEILSACRKASGVAIVLVLIGRTVGTARWCPIPWGELEPLIAEHRAKQAEVEKGVPERHRRFAGAPASINRDAIVRFAVTGFDYLRSPLVGPGR